MPDTSTEVAIATTTLGSATTTFTLSSIPARLTGNGSSASSNQSTSNTYIGLFPCTNAANTFALKTVDIFSYAGSTYKTCLVENSGDENGSGSVDRQVGLWRSTSAITSITIVNAGGANFQVGTTATLYGIL
jgi:hypothetical protein